MESYPEEREWLAGTWDGDFFVYPYNSWLHYSFYVFLINVGQTPFRYTFREHR